MSVIRQNLTVLNKREDIQVRTPSRADGGGCKRRQGPIARRNAIHRPETDLDLFEAPWPGRTNRCVQNVTPFVIVHD